MSPPRAAVSAEEIAASPAWFPLEPARSGGMRLLCLDEAAYRSASFLDRRLLQTSPREALVDFATIASAAAMLVPRAHYIFHIGHVGSTLISRLVGEFPHFFSIREPPLLRELAASPARRQVGGTIDLRAASSLLGRTWRPDQRAIIKASSFVSEISEAALELDPTARAVLMFTPAPVYLCCILGGPNSRLEARALAASRLRRLQQRLGGAALDIDPASEGQWLAMSWLCEMACLQQTSKRFGARVLWVDFDGFLAAPHAGLDAILRTLGGTAAAGEIDRVLGSPLMQRYSKAPEHAYDAGLRQEVLASAAREHEKEIGRGIIWLRQLAERHRIVAESLSH